MPLALAVVTFLCFAPALGNEFVNWDDQINFTRNPHYRGLSVENLRWIFSYHKGHYTPLTWLSLGLDYVVWGMDPFGYHLGNLLLHVANVVLFYYVALGLRARPMAAVVAALFFGIHPLRVESVVWATERRDVLSGLFCLLAVLSYLRMARAGKGADARRWYWLSLGAYFLSLSSKILALPLPLVLLVMDVYLLGRAARLRALLVEKLPFFALAVLAAVVALWAERSAGALYGATRHTLVDALMQPGYRVFFYLGKTLLPIRLSPLYAYRPMTSVFELRYVLGTAALIAVSAGFWFGRHRWPAGLAAWACYGILIGPVIGIVQFGPHFAADRNTYLAGLPWALLLGTGAARWLLPPLNSGRAAAVGAAFLVLGATTVGQAQVWKDSLSLWNAALARDGFDPMALNNRALARLEKGDVDGALVDFDLALKLDQRYANSYNNRGSAWLRKNVADRAIADFDQALRIQPHYAEALFNRCLARLGSGDPDGAITDCTEGLKLSPSDAGGLRSRAIAHLGKDDAARAIADATASLSIEPDDAETLGTRGVARARSGETAGAIVDFERALAHAPPGWARKSVVEKILEQQRGQARLRQRRGP